jgi:hypothetical protein
VVVVVAVVFRVPMTVVHVVLVVVVRHGLVPARLAVPVLVLALVLSMLLRHRPPLSW